MKRYLIVLTYLAIFLIACSLFAASGPNTVPNEPNSSAEITGDSTAVTVNGVDITESQIEAEVKPQLEKIAAQLSPAFAEQYKKQLRQQVLERMIIEQLLDQKVKAAGIVITEEEVIGRVKEMASKQRPPLSLEDFKALIEAYGKSFDDVKQRIKKGLGYEKIMEAQWAGKINITEEDANKYYAENAKEMEQVKASHILVKLDIIDPNIDPNEAKAKTREKAEDMLKQIKDGADFAELAKANSSCPSAAKGGDLGFFSRGQMAPAFENAAFELKVGQISDIVETRFGFNIIKVTDRKDTFNQFKDDIINILTQKKQGEFAEKYIESLKTEASIVYPPGKEPEPAQSIEQRPNKVTETRAKAGQSPASSESAAKGKD